MSVGTNISHPDDLLHRSTRARQHKIGRMRPRQWLWLQGVDFGEDVVKEAVGKDARPAVVGERDVVYLQLPGMPSRRSPEGDPSTAGEGSETPGASEVLEGADGVGGSQRLGETEDAGVEVGREGERADNGPMDVVERAGDMAGGMDVKRRDVVKEEGADAGSRAMHGSEQHVGMELAASVKPEGDDARGAPGGHFGAQAGGASEEAPGDQAWSGWGPAGGSREGMEEQGMSISLLGGREIAEEQERMGGEQEGRGGEQERVAGDAEEGAWGREFVESMGSGEHVRPRTSLLVSGGTSNGDADMERGTDVAGATGAGGVAEGREERAPHAPKSRPAARDAADPVTNATSALDGETGVENRGPTATAGACQAQAGEHGAFSPPLCAAPTAQDQEGTQHGLLTDLSPVEEPVPRRPERLGKVEVREGASGLTTIELVRRAAESAREDLGLEAVSEVLSESEALMLASALSRAFGYVASVSELSSLAELWAADELRSLEYVSGPSRRVSALVHALGETGLSVGVHEWSMQEEIGGKRSVAPARSRPPSGTEAGDGRDGDHGRGSSGREEDVRAAERHPVWGGLRGAYAPQERRTSSAREREREREKERERERERRIAKKLVEPPPGVDRFVKVGYGPFLVEHLVAGLEDKIRLGHVVTKVSSKPGGVEVSVDVPLADSGALDTLGCLSCAGEACILLTRAP